MTTNEALGAAIQDAARDLPEGWQIQITVERGAGWAELYNPEGTRADDFADGDLDLHESIRHGIELAAVGGEGGQEYADQTVAEAYRQPLKTIHEALAVHGWDADPFPEDYKPTCCGSEVSIRSFLGAPYFVQCEVCKKFLVDVTGPQFGNSWVNLPDGEKIDLESDIEHRWIAGQE